MNKESLQEKDEIEPANEIYDAIDLAWTQSRFLSEFLKSITDFKLENVCEAIVANIAEFLGCQTVILYISASGKIRPVTIWNKENVIDLQSIKSIRLNGLDINSIIGESKNIYDSNVELYGREVFVIDTAITFPLLNEYDHIVGWVTIDLNNSKFPKDQIVKIVGPYSSSIGSILTNTMNLETEHDKYKDEIVKLNTQLDSTIEINNNLRVQNRNFNIKRIFITSFGIFVALVISLGTMIIVEKFNFKGKDFFYGMAGFTAFFAIIAVSFKLITEVKFEKFTISNKNDLSQ